MILNPQELPSSERKAQLGCVFLRAIAVSAGYEIDKPETDYDSIDLAVRSRLGRRQRLEFQVKATSQSSKGAEAADFPFPLLKKNYDDLRIDVIVPRLLFVVVLPKKADHWVRLSARRMNLRRCGYWLSLRGEPPRSNKRSVTVRIPRGNILTPEVLTSLMEEGALQ